RKKVQNLNRKLPLNEAGEWLLRARKKSTWLSIIDYAQRSLGNIWGYIYQLRAGNIFLSTFERLRTLYYSNRYD
ncbi:hypothetical protein C0J52_26781, partial [Blattella germanica]